jgi:hypothetical protein
MSQKELALIKKVIEQKSFVVVDMFRIFFMKSDRSTRTLHLTSELVPKSTHSAGKWQKHII